MPSDRFNVIRAALIVAGIAAVAALGMYDRRATPPARVGDSVASLALTGLDAQPFALALTGRPTVVNVFATWCPECRSEMPQLRALQRSLAKRGVTLVAVDQAESPAVVARYASTFASGIPTAIDTTNLTARVLGVRFIPSTFVFGADSRIRAIFTGPLDASAMAALETLALEPGTAQISDR